MITRRLDSNFLSDKEVQKLVDENKNLKFDQETANECLRNTIRELSKDDGQFFICLFQADNQLPNFYEIYVVSRLSPSAYIHMIKTLIQSLPPELLQILGHELMSDISGLKEGANA